MDRQTAKEYHAHLWKRMKAPRPIIDRLFWIPLLGGLAYLTFNSVATLALGASIGWGICAILSKLDEAKRELYICEFYRHLHEHTDEAESGKTSAEMQLLVQRQSQPWWSRIR